MAEFIKTKLGIKHNFNPISNRHYLNGFQTVYHCHHFTTLYSQLALDAGETESIAKVSEEAFYDVLYNYFEENNIFDIKEKIEIACQYYSALGLGIIEVENIGDFSGKVISKSSHVEEGWIKKWGQYDKPVNYIGCGYISAMMSAVLDKPVGTFSTEELESIVMGSKQTVYKSFIK